MVVGTWCEWRAKGLVCPGCFQASGGGEKMPEVEKGMQSRVLGAPPARAPWASPGASQGEGGGRAGGGVHWLVSQECKKRGGSSQRASCICFQRKREVSVWGYVSELVLSGQAQGCCDPKAGAGIWAPAFASCSRIFSPFTRESDHRVPTQNLLISQASLLYVSVIPGFGLWSELLRPAGHTCTGAWAHGVLAEDRESDS